MAVKMPNSLLNKSPNLLLKVQICFWKSKFTIKSPNLLLKVQILLFFSSQVYKLIIWTCLFFSQKSIQFCIPKLETPQPILPWWRSCPNRLRIWWLGALQCPNSKRKNWNQNQSQACLDHQLTAYLLLMYLVYNFGVLRVFGGRIELVSRIKSLWGITKVYLPPVSVPGAQSRKNDAIPPKWFNSLDTNSMAGAYCLV